MKYRNQADIIKRILEIANQGATKTRIMYKAVLTSAQLNDYISFLTENELVKQQKGSGRYHLTEKGQRLYLKCKEPNTVSETKRIRKRQFDTKDRTRRKRIHRTYRFHG